MSKKQFKSQASSSRVVSGAFGTNDGALGIGAFGGAPSTFGAVSSSPLSYIYEAPDLATISEPNLVVAFKNVQKKDSTTKAKALEELQLYVQSLNEKNEVVEEAILEAWIRIYPRTSIDSTRRVRQLAHLIQGHLSVSCGKRIAKCLPTIVGPWLIGLYDTDRSVTRATQESLERVFPSEEKRNNLWRLYRSPIVDFCLNAIKKETVNSLSDERTTSPDDALAKHARVVGASILVVTKIIEDFSVKQSQTYDDALDNFIAEEKVWDLASLSDAFVRRAICRILVAALGYHIKALDMKVISAKLLASSLAIDQTGSASDYAKALASLTQRCPEVWTQHYTASGKKSSSRRLQQFLKKGSQGGPPAFWVHIGSMMSNVPSELLTLEQHDDAAEKEAPSENQSQLMLRAILSALRNRNEPSMNLAAGWTTYLSVFERVQGLLADESTRCQHLRDFILPIVTQYIKPSQEGSDWSVAKTYQTQLILCVKAFLLVWNGAKEILHDQWVKLSEQLVEDIETSLPEQSRDHLKSQNFISEEALRWFSLEGGVLKEDDSESIRALFENTSSSILTTAIESIRSRNGKPSSATATLVAALQLAPQLLYGNAELESLIYRFIQKDGPNLLLSPSVPYFFTLLDLLHGKLDVDQPYQAGLRSLKNAPESPVKSRALTSLLSSPFPAKGGNTELLQSLMNDVLESAISGDESYWNLVQIALQNSAAPVGLIDSLLANLAANLEMDDKVLGSLTGLNIAVKSNNGAVKICGSSSGGAKLLSRLFFLGESSDEDIAQRAKALSSVIQGLMSGQDGADRGMQPLVEIIHDGLNTPTASSLSIESLVKQAQKLYSEAEEDRKAELGSQLMPSAAQWATALAPISKHTVNPALAITNTLSNAIALIAKPTGSTDVAQHSIPRDSDGFSSALRLAWYAVKLAKQADNMLHGTGDEKMTTCRGVVLVLQLTTDDLSVYGQNYLLAASRSETEKYLISFMHDAQSLLSSWLQSKQDVVLGISDKLLEGCRLFSTWSYYNARAYSAIIVELGELHGLVEEVSSSIQGMGLHDGQRTADGSSHEHQEQIAQVREPKWPDSTFSSLAIIASAPETSRVTKLVNELIAQITGHDFRNDGDEGLLFLLCLNCIIYRYENIPAGIPKPRLVFFIKSLVTALGRSSPLSTFAEILRALNVVLPYVKETYDEFWGQLLALLPRFWSRPFASDDEVPLLHASLRLLSTIRGLVAQESNDDLVDSWKENERSISDGLLEILKKLQGIPDDLHQPRKMTNDLLSRQITKSPPKSIPVAAELYPVVGSESLALQQSAYNILHPHIHKQQEQVSLDKALTKDHVVQLPEELLSLILAPPDEDALAEMSFERSIPAVLRSYFLSWNLVYDHWTNASYPVQADYANSLKEGTYLKGLLDFAFRYLITERSRPVDASKFDIINFSPRGAESPETATQYYLIHLYTLSLSLIPNLTKTWWRDSTSRQTMIAVESWTEKYISPLIITNELTTVSAWAPSQATADQPLTIKVSLPAREITASIPIDEQTMSIAIRLPPSYPLARATVESIHRVGVDEKKWRSWLITTQGVINFSGEGNGGSLIEGLLAWRKNVTATLKGQTECSICYSVVSAERQLPSKRCGTCRNMFHGGCLYRWFKSSNSSSCPLCRNAFHYS